MQAITKQLGGLVAPGAKREYGHAMLHLSRPDSPLFAGLPPSTPVWMSHGDKIEEMPPDFTALAYTENSPVAVMGNGDGIFGLQFHPEVAHTPEGNAILRNFVYRICGCKGNWTMGSFISESLQKIKEQVGDGKVICALSGGVDSAVVATLIHRDASERFLARLQSVIDPEMKRKVIGEEFIRVFEEEANQAGRVDFLAQGTLYPDVIESISSVSTASAKIKTHHNVGGLPARMTLNLLEPLRYLFKDEVRQVGLELGLPEEMVWRQPFPGPGLAIRIIGEVTREKLEILRSADFVVMNEIKKAKLYRQLWQSFAILPDVRSVGVMGDFRTYGYLVAIRAVTSDDAMTADWSRLPYDLLARISNRIVNEVSEVNRVVYDITSKPPSTIEWE
jgi:GMP synthase (glutamine-hydrolysing)